MPDYELSYSADNIDTALGKVVNIDTTPVSGSDNAVESGGVFSHVSDRVGTVDRNDDVDDLQSRVAALEALEPDVAYGYKSGVVNDNNIIEDLDTVSPSSSIAVQPTNGKYTVRSGKSGVYLVRLFGTISRETNCRVTLYKNGSALGDEWLKMDSGGSHGYMRAAELCLELDDGDFLQLFQGASANPTLDKFGLRVERLS